MRDPNEHAAPEAERADPQRTVRDTLYAQPRGREDFVFDHAVAAVFPDMIRRSVPGYETALALTGLVAARHLPAGGRCYDLGCSLGAVTRAALSAVGDRDCEVIAVDASAAMLSRAKALAGPAPRVRWQQADVRTVPLTRADVVVLAYTMQFLPVADRLPLLARIRAAMTDGGVLVLTEKLVADGYFEALHLDFKRANGYSELEIAGKRAALENVMRIDTEETHLARLAEAGFGDATLWFRCLNWGSFLAWPHRRPS